MSDTSLVITEAKNGIATLTINRPDKRNALSRELISELLKAVEQIETDDSIRVLCLKAAGSVFCAGMDLGEMQARATDPNAKDEWQHDTEIYLTLLKKLFAIPVPTIAVVHGPALAGGLGMVLACDFIVAAEEAFFALPEPKRGIVAAIVTPFLVYRVGPHAASNLLLSGERQSASNALQTGLCQHTVPLSGLEERVTQLVASILTGSRSALASTKAHLQSCAAGELFAQLDTSSQLSAEARETPDAREGLAAFLEKRQPNWTPAQ